MQNALLEASQKKPIKKQSTNESKRNTNIQNEEATQQFNVNKSNNTSDFILPFSDSTPHKIENELKGFILNNSFYSMEKPYYQQSQFRGTDYSIIFVNFQRLCY